MIQDADDLHGHHVNYASRVSSKADGREIVISRVLWEIVESSGVFAFSAPRKRKFKGLTGYQHLYPVVWDADSPSAAA